MKLKQQDSFEDILDELKVLNSKIEVIKQFAPPPRPILIVFKEANLFTLLFNIINIINHFLGPHPSEPIYQENDALYTPCMPVPEPLTDRKSGLKVIEEIISVYGIWCFCIFVKAFCRELVSIRKQALRRRNVLEKTPS